MPEAVRFRVLKGIKFLFECEIASEDALPSELQRQCVRADEMGFLRNADITITKRLNIVEVDRMIACCRQHPPQALVAPLASDQAAFEDLAAYLKQRERAGVGSIGPGMLVMLIPIQHRNDYLRCQIVNTATTVGEIGAQVSTAFAPAIDQRPSGALSAAPQLPQQPPPPAPLDTISNESSSTTIVETPAASIPTIVETLAVSTNSIVEREPEMQIATGDDVCAAVAKEVTTTEEASSDDPFASLRHEHAAFNSFYHHVLLEWSTKPSDTIDSAHELPHQI